MTPEPYLYGPGPPEPPRDPPNPKTLNLKLSFADPKCYIFLESLDPDLHPPAFRTPSGPLKGGLLMG